VFGRLLLHFNLAAFGSHNLRPPATARYLSYHAHPQVFVLIFRRPKLFAIRSPNQNSENFSRAGFVQIQKRWLAFSTLCIVRANDFAAHRRPVADVMLGFGGGKFLGLGVKVWI
jgi:hypothetical protein